MMSWFRRRRKDQANGQEVPAGSAPFDYSPITYVVIRIGERWFATLCADRTEALAVQHALEDQGWYAFAGEARSVESAHWQLRDALRVYWSGTGPMPWTGSPKAKGGRGVNVQLLRTSFEHAVNSDPNIVHHFYQRLFRDYPETRNYFPRSMAGQERALGEKLVEIMLHLEDTDYLVTHLAALGARHATQYRVKPEMYGCVKDALIATLAGAVASWNDELQREWDGALTTVATLMLAGDPAQTR